MGAAAALLLSPAACVGTWGVGGDVDVVPDANDDDDAAADVEKCEPLLTMANASFPNYTEGDGIELRFDCSSGAARERFRASLTGMGPGATFDGASWTALWLTGLADGGRHDVLLTVRSREAEEQGLDLLPEVAVATLWVADAYDDPGNAPVDPAAYTEEWGLPVIHLAPAGGLSEEYVPAQVTFMGHSYDAEMKLRGAASLSYPKNSYTLRFGDEDLDASSVGMGNKDHLILITTFDDNSYVRQKLAYDLWIAMADHAGAQRLTPRTFFAVVYLDGEYWGLYTACDRIDDHFAQEMGLSRDGNLYKSVNHDANFYRTNASGGTKSTLHDGYEKKEGDPPEGQEGAFDDLDALVAFSADSDDQTFHDQAPSWIRVDEFADWFLFVHYIAADDSGGKNAYLYDDPEDLEFRYCPWDMNHSFGQGWYTYRIDPDTYNDFIWTNGIFAHLQHHPQDSADLWQRFGDLRADGPLRVTWFLDAVDGYYRLIDPSARRDWDVWGAEYQSYWGSSNTNDYQAERAYLVDWLVARDTWMTQYHP